jgi:CopG family transcriptional regulator, nickel-responsive regulator
MPQLERIGVSLEKDLLSAFDALIASKGYNNRSEAIRDLIRQQLSQEQIENPKSKAVGVAVIVYDHHAAKLADSLIEMQHSHTMTQKPQIISSMHVHLDEHNCLEIIVLKGLVSDINKLGEHILSMKGVKLGRLNLVTV